MDQLFGGTPGRRRQAQLQVNNLGLPRPTESRSTVGCEAATKAR